MTRLLFLLLLLQAGIAHAAKIDAFSPRGEAKDVRQVVARFSAPMVAFGDPRTEAPFDIDCAAPGRGRWVDARVWVYDFDADLPAGLECAFTAKAALKIEGERRYAFTTGGPAIRGSRPSEGARIDEDQAFILALDARADDKSVADNAYCQAEGVSERIPVRLIQGDERTKLLAEQKRVVERLARERKRDEVPFAVLACARRLPAGAQLKLVWGAGIRAEKSNAIATRQAQTLSFRVRPDFVATVTCTRVNKDAGCVPVLPIEVELGAQITPTLAAGVTLTAPDGTKYPVTFAESSVDRLTFRGPFPAKTTLTLAIPSDFVDDARRPLVNAGMFPVKVAIDDDPPLVKFPSRFGILERYASPALPVTVRNVEAPLRGIELKVGGRLARVPDGDDAALAAWLTRVLEGPREDDARLPIKDALPDGQLSIFSANEARVDARPIELPRAEGEKAFEVIGIPLTAPGFYIVELASPRLGEALFGRRAPYYVYSSALVTNLAIHFKLGRESSLAWVTALDTGRPVAGAKVTVSHCEGASYWSGTTDANGIARIDRELPRDHAPCTGLFVTARAGDDMAFMLTAWNEGSQRGGFNLTGGAGGEDGAIAAHTVFDRPLFRAGETVSMKHFLRLRNARGFATMPARDAPTELVIRHAATDQTFTQKLAWTAGVSSSTWSIPKDAKLGEYAVAYAEKRAGATGYARMLEAGSFRVEEFRVPLMKAVLKPQAPVVNATEVKIDAQLAYLSGGGASYAQVKLRSRLMRAPQTFADYADFSFGGAEPKEGIQALAAGDEEEGDPAARPRAQSLTLDQAGGGRFTIDKLPPVKQAHALEVEMEYADPNGQILTAATRVPVLPAAVALGIKTDGFFATNERMPFKVVALSLEGKPVAGARITVDAYQRKVHGYRKRLLGGFYGYDQSAETKRLGSVCNGTSDARGLVTCAGGAPATGELTLVARASDPAGNTAIAARELFVAGADDWWAASSSDRIDLLPDKRRYEPGETARLEVRMPFREATALVTIEREGVIESRTVPISAKAPFIDVPIAGNYAPNAYVSVLVVRGRVDPVAPGAFAWLKRWIYKVGMWVGLVKSLPREVDTRPTALVDLTKPAFKIGLAELVVGWREHELKVKVEPEREAFRVRDKAMVRVAVTDAAGKPAAGAEIALAAVDEGLLALAPNRSWNLLGAMMTRRALEVDSSTAQSQVIGKRHFGRKAVAAGGGGGDAGSRELFDTLLVWRDRVTLDAEGRATIEVPINDSLTSFRIEAIAHQGDARFGSGGASIRTTQELMLFSGLPQLVREGDRFSAMLTLRNGADRPLAVEVSAAASGTTLAPQSVALAPGEGKTVSFAATAPYDARTLDWTFTAAERGGTARDSLKIKQEVRAAHPVRVLQASLAQLDAKPLEFRIERPAGAVPGRGGIELKLARSLGGDVSAIRDWIGRYPYTCLEQQASRAVILADKALWDRIGSALPLYLDGDGLARYFPTDRLQGDDALTAYLLSIAQEAGLEIPSVTRERMTAGLAAFVEGRVRRYGDLPTADLAIRKLAAIEALSRYGSAQPKMLDSIEIAPNLWPTSALVDWISIAKRMTRLPRRDERLAEAKAVLRSRLAFGGTTLTFSTENTDKLWWLMVSPDLNAVRTILALVDQPDFREEMPRLARGTIGRQREGRWTTTTANAWGVLALQAFARQFERDPVSGTTAVNLGGDRRKVDWAGGEAGAVTLAWPERAAPLAVAHEGGGKPWVIVQSRAALPLKEPLQAGYVVKRSVTPVEQKTKGIWSRGDAYRVTLEVEAQSDMTWVVVNDPIPSGAAILGDSSLLAGGERRDGFAWLAFEERASDAYRAYYRYVPKGRFSVQYTVRLNNAGMFELPAARVEAMYAPETFAELPVASIEVRE